MKQSKYFVKTLKQPPKDDISKNAKLLIRAGYLDKLMSGVYTFLPLGWRVIKKIEQIIRNEMNSVGGQEIFMPALHPIENYIKTKRNNIDVLFHLESVDGKKLVLGQSHEEVIVPLVKQYIQSYKNLPLYLYQIQTKFRNELRAKSGILRVREFIMKDLYSFHKDESDFDKYYKKMLQSYHNIFKALGIGNQTYLTYASGGTFSKFSHEFQTITSAGEDIIHLCKNCKIAINNDLINKQKTCPKCKQTNFTKQKAIEVGNTFPLKTKFSDAFKLLFTDEDGNKKPVVMGCYGIGLGRLMGTIVEIHNDNNGIIWPASVTPFDAHLICLGDKEEVKKHADTIYQTLKKNGFDILYDERNESAGKKLKDADLIGITVRLLISDKTGDKIEFKYRSENESKNISLTNVINEMKALTK
jgi:prolyl-tRNA synthetase